MRKRVGDLSLSIRKISEKANKHEDCVRLDIGQPSFDTPEYVKEKAKEELSKEQSYTPLYGIQELREAIVEGEKKKKAVGPMGMDLGPEDVMVTVGATQALYTVFASMLSTDDKVVLDDPCWVPYQIMSEVNGNNWEQVNFFDDGGLTDGAKEAIDGAEMVVVNTPTNPTGQLLTENEAKEIGEYADDAGTLLVSDEVYHRFVYGGEHYSPTAYCENSIVVGSVSKSHAMTGWRIGWLVAREEPIEDFKKVSRAIIGCPPKINQLASIHAIRNDKHVKRMKGVYRKRRDLVVRRLRKMNLEFKEPQGSFYVFPHVGRDSWDFCLDMIEKGVAMVPGEPFGPGSKENVRICFGSATEKEINKGLDILQDELIR